jgi:hypothetical protein
MHRSRTKAGWSGCAAISRLDLMTWIAMNSCSSSGRAQRRFSSQQQKSYCGTCFWTFGQFPVRYKDFEASLFRLLQQVAIAQSIPI